MRQGIRNKVQQGCIGHRDILVSAIMVIIDDQDWGWMTILIMRALFSPAAGVGDPQGRLSRMVVLLFQGSTRWNQKIQKRKTICRTKKKLKSEPRGSRSSTLPMGSPDATHPTRVMLLWKKIKVHQSLKTSQELRNRPKVWIVNWAKLG